MQTGTPEKPAHRGAGKSLWETEERFRAVFDSVDKAIVICDGKDGTILDVNRAVQSATAAALRATPEAAAMGLPTDWAYRVVKELGNYGEIYERNITPLGLERGINGQWNKGGLMYAPPLR